MSATISVDQGHPWQPPFGLERIGRLPMAQVELSTGYEPSRQYYLTGYNSGREVEQHALKFSNNESHYSGTAFAPPDRTPPPFYAHTELATVPTEVALHARCGDRTIEIARERIDWPELEVDASTRPSRLRNPLDLGTILPPHDWLLVTGGEAATVDVVAFSRNRDFPNARLRVWFDGGKPVDVALRLTRNRRLQKQLRLPAPTEADRAILHVQLTDADRRVWKKEIRTMIVPQAPNWPSFGAIETKLRYDAPMEAVDPKSGARLPPIDYDHAWQEKFKDVVVFLPNGSRFVFWRGSNYIPFWAGSYNTGVLYQWAEDCSGALIAHPDGSRDCPEPLFDSELRYSRVRIVESTVSRVHVRWDYQLTDASYEVRRGQASEDFYFYPDGFGTRVVTAASAPGAAYQLSELIIITPQAAYPLDVLPQHIVEVVPLDSGKERIKFPAQPAPESATGWRVPKLIEPRSRPMLYRVFGHRDDPASAIYFHPSDPAVPRAYLPFYDKGLLVTPTYWGNHWPLNRGKWTGWAINDEITVSPGHNSVAMWYKRDPETRKWDWEVKPLSTSELLMPDSSGQVRIANLLSFAWMIAYTDVSDEMLRNWGKSFSAPPAVDVEGARPDLPSYSPERRALRLVAEQSAITIRLKPAEHTVNPVFEIDRAPRSIDSITLDGKSVPPDAYAWDGAVLWIKANIGAKGAVIAVRFK